MINVLKDSGFRTGWHVIPVFRIKLHLKDEELLKEVQAFFVSPQGIGVGKISRGKDYCEYMITSLRDIVKVIIPHFDNYPLITQKASDYLLFKRIIDLMKLKEHLTSEGLKNIVLLKSSLNLGLSDQLKAAFSNLPIFPRPPPLRGEAPPGGWTSSGKPGSSTSRVIVRIRLRGWKFLC